jgi:hypothetical protein
MGKDEASSAETKAHNIGSGQKQNRSRSAGEVGEGEGAAEEGSLEPTEPAASMRQAFTLEVNRSMPGTGHPRQTVRGKMNPHNT